MKPVDLRNAQFETIRSDLSGRLREVYEAWARLGPMTTRDLANASGIDILNVRPRTTDLFGLGLVELVNSVRGSEGIYRARTADDWRTWRDTNFLPASTQQYLNM